MAEYAKNEGVTTQDDVTDGDNDDFSVALKRFGYCVDAESINRNFQRDDMRFYAGSPDNGWQWPDRVLALRQNDPNGARPCLTINKLPQHVHQITNEQRQNRASIKVLPVDDKADPEMAEQFNGIIRHIEYVSDADVAYSTANERQVAHGEGYWRVLTDYVSDDSFDQEIFIKRIRNSFTVHVDPNAQEPTASDATYGFIDEVITESEFKARFPDKPPISWDNQGQDEWYQNWFLTGERKVRIAEYFYQTPENKRIWLWADGVITDTNDPRPDYPGEPINFRDVKAKKWKWCKLYGEGILEQQDWPGSLFPIVRLIGNEFDVDGQLLFTGLVRNAKDPQRMYNYWTSSEAEFGALAAKAPYIGAAGQFEGYEYKWDQANIKNFSYLEYQPVTEGGQLVPPPQRIAPPQASSAFIQMKAAMSEDIKATTGQYDPSLGRRVGNQSGVAIRQLQSEGDVANLHYADNFGRAKKQTGKILIDLIPKVYDARRILRILGEDGTPDQIIVDPRIPKAVQPVMQQNPQTGEMEEIAKLYNPSVGRYDVMVELGPSYTTKRQEAAEHMGDAIQANPALWNVIGDLFVKNQDWPGASDMAKRLRTMLDPRVLQSEEGNQGPSPESQAAMEQAKQAMLLVEQKQQELQTMETQLKGEVAKTVAEKSKLEEAKVQLNAEKRILEADYARIRAELKCIENGIEMGKKELEMTQRNAMPMN